MKDYANQGKTFATFFGCLKKIFQGEEEAEEKSLSKKNAPSEQSAKTVSPQPSALLQEQKTAKEPVNQSVDERSVIPPKEYTIAAEHKSSVALRLLTKNRVVTNNVFTLEFEQDGPTNPTHLPAIYEAFFIDGDGEIISNIQTISARLQEEPFKHKATFTLKTKDSFKEDASVILALRYAGASTQLVSKTEFTMQITFANDFDF